MDSIAWTGSALRLTLAEPGPACALVTYEHGSERQTVVKASASGLGVFDIPLFERPTRFSAQVLTIGKAEKATPLYVSRPVLNASEIIAWFRSQGVASTLTADDMHTTVAYSKAPVIWSVAGSHFDQLVVPTSPGRAVGHLGPSAALVLHYTSDELQRRFGQFLQAGASWDYDGYMPHITITYEGADINPAALIPWFGKIVLGPEVFSELDTDWEAKES